MNRSINLLTFFIFLLLITGALSCSDNDVEEQEFIQALTENDFAKDATIFARLDGLILNFLEHPGSEETNNDTGETGNDVIPVTYQRTVQHTFCWEDDNEEAEHFLEITDSEGILILRLDANGDCVTESIEAGDYIITLFHDGLSEDSYSIFLIPTGSTLILEEQATNQLIQYFKLVKANALSYLQNSITKEATAQTVQDNINTLIRTNSCQGCDLSGADLSGVILTQANLSGANLSGADLRQTNLNGANFAQALLDSSTNLSEATLDSAIWCDGSCICAAKSFGACVGCAPIEKVCTGP